MSKIRAFLVALVMTGLVLSTVATAAEKIGFLVKQSEERGSRLNGSSPKRPGRISASKSSKSASRTAKRP
ncbi:MAG: hypothetical protein LUG50_04415 [Planctomycetaceae bacterium]|nr:hypothetical protein [Planctomycetaceae bacterium]